MNDQDLLLPRSELERRGKYINLLESRSSSLPALVELVKQCLHNDPKKRPSTEELLTRLQQMRVEEQGEREVGLPISIMINLAHKVNDKSTRIDALAELKV